MIIAKEKYKDTYIVYIDESKGQYYEGNQLAYPDFDTVMIERTIQRDQNGFCPNCSNIMGLLFHRGRRQPPGGRRMDIL